MFFLYQKNGIMDESLIPFCNYCESKRLLKAERKDNFPSKLHSLSYTPHSLLIDTLLSEIYEF